MHLDEISDKIEREKHRNIKSNHHEKIKIWNELKSIHRVFEPLYAIKENQHKLGGNKSPVSKANTQQNVANCSSEAKGKKIVVAAFVKQPRLLRRAEHPKRNTGLETTARRTENTTSPYF